MGQNDANVRALTTAIREAWAAQAGDWARRHNAGGTNPEQVPALPLNLEKLATALATEGIVAPSALTDDELLACKVDQEARASPVERAEVAATVRDRLQRIARGEA